MAFRPDILAGRAVIVVSIQDKLNQELRTIRATLRRFSNSISQIGGDLFRFGAVGSLAAFFPVRAFVEFQDQMLFMQIKLQATDAVMKDLEKTVLQLGRTTSFTSTEVAEGGTELAKADFTARQIKDSLQAVLDLGRGAKIPLAEAAKLVVNTLQAFKLPAEEAARVASAFTTAARKGTIDVIELKESMKELIGTFRFLNIPLSESLALVTALSFSSIKGTKAGTSLNTMFLNMARNAKKLNQELGVQPFVGGQFVGIISFLDQMETGLNKLTQEQQLSKVAEIFNIRGGRAQAALFLRGLDKIKDTINEIGKNADEARRSALQLDSALGGFFKRAKSSFENLNIAIGRTAEGPLSKILDNARKAFIALEGLAGINPKLFQSLILIPPIALIVGAALLGLSSIAATFATILTPFIIGTGLLFTGLVKLIIANKGLLKVFTTLKGIRRLAFGGSGILLLLEALIIFGDKLPVIGGVFRVVETAFTNLGRNLGLMLPGLKSAFGIMSDGFSDENTERGFVRMKSGFEEVRKIITVGLTQAWNDFWKDFEPITSRITAFLGGMFNVLTSIVGAIDDVGKSLGRLLFGDTSALAEKGLAGLFSASNINRFFEEMEHWITDLGKLIADVVDGLNRVVSDLAIIPKIAKTETLTQVEKNRRSGLTVTGPPTKSRTETESNRIGRLREDMQNQALRQDALKSYNKMLADMAERFGTLNRNRGKEVAGGAMADLAPIAAGIAASLVGSFEGTRGAKLKLLESKEDQQLVELRKIAENTDPNNEDDSF